jgi:hypothetical protein
VSDHWPKGRRKLFNSMSGLEFLITHGKGGEVYECGNARYHSRRHTQVLNISDWFVEHIKYK